MAETERVQPALRSPGLPRGPSRPAASSSSQSVA